MKKILFFIAITLFVGACGDKDDGDGFDAEAQAAIDDKIIQDYLEENNLDNVTKHSSGLYYEITKEGTGGNPNIYSTVSVYYEGRLMETGEVFDDNGGKVAIFLLNGLIKGWQIGIPLLKKGGTGTFYIPSGLAYGTSDTGTIPANSVLIFDIYLADFY